MFLKYIDFISHPLTLHYQKFKQHSSTFSILLSFITYIILIIYSLYLFIDLIHHLNPTTFCYTRYEDDIGNFPVNETSMFHFFTFTSFPENENIENIIEIIGINNFDGSIIDYVLNLGSRLSFSHYIYGKCPENWNKYKLNNIENLIKENPINKGFCIVGYYNITINKYFSINDDNFPYPVIEKGASNPNFTAYQILIKSCENDTFYHFNKCKSKDYINDMMSNKIINVNLNMLNQEVDANNYKQPMIHKFFKIASVLSLINTFSVNNINFQPLRVKSMNNLFDKNKFKLDYSYYFEQNDIKNIDALFPIYTSYIFWMQNKVYVYERNYRKFNNLMADIGGILNTIIAIAKIINYLFCKYQTFLDVEKILIKKIRGMNNNLNKNSMNKFFDLSKKINYAFEKDLSKKNNNESNSIMISKYSQNLKMSETPKIKIMNENKMNYNCFSYINGDNFLLNFNSKNGKKIGLFSLIWYQFFNSKSKKSIYIQIIKNYYKQIVSEENLFDLYFFFSTFEKQKQKN